TNLQHRLHLPVLQAYQPVRSGFLRQEPVRRGRHQVHAGQRWSASPVLIGTHSSSMQTGVATAMWPSKKSHPSGWLFAYLSSMLYALLVCNTEAFCTANKTFCRGSLSLTGGRAPGCPVICWAFATRLSWSFSSMPFGLAPKTARIPGFCGQSAGMPSFKMLQSKGLIFETGSV